MNYHYVCRDCGATRILSVHHDDPTKHLYDSGQMAHECGGVYKRQWGFRLSKYAHQDPKTGRIYTSEREFARDLKTRSQIATDRTGIVHDFQPVDLFDPSVAPSSDDGLKEQHDAQIARGEKTSKGKFVHTVAD
jgi:hypothetical protein